MKPKGQLAIVSGGMDSVTLAYVLADLSKLGGIASFDYGQKHSKELDAASITAERLRVPWLLLNLKGTIAAGSSALTSRTPVPEGHYAEDSMRATVVPNRNAVMMSVAVSHAVAQGYEAVAVGVHSGDHFIYPDCRPEFVLAFSAAMRLATLGFAAPGFHINAPFMFFTKAHIVEVGYRHGVPFEDTWSCYVGGEFHCGACGTCFERREAFKVAGVEDPTTYVMEPDFLPPAGIEEGYAR